MAYLAGRWRDIAAAEDALAEAFARALETWPESGVPEAPEKWLFSVAHRQLADGARHAAVRARWDVVEAVRAQHDSPEPRFFPDERLRLMLVCAHPAIDAAVRPALVLQTVLGLDAKTMASAFLVSPQAMTKRLVRAKAKIRLSGMRFEEPEPADMGVRLQAVLEAIYAAYFLGVEGSHAEGDGHEELRREALYLANVVAERLPEDAEALGFVALLELCEARRPAGIGPEGEFVPLLEQDTALWDRELMARGQRTLARAATLREPGPFQLEAAIQAAHCYRARSGSVPWREIATLYRRLVGQYPTIGASVGMAVAVAHAEGAREGLALLEQLDRSAIRDYAPWWVAAAHLHELDGDLAAARRCLSRAVGLTTHPRSRAYLEQRLAAQT